MALEKLERVMWRIRSKNEGKKVPNTALNRAIYVEIGYDRRTIKRIRRVLIELGWIKKDGTSYIILTDKDLTGDY